MLAALAALALAFASSAAASDAPKEDHARLRYDPRFILERVAAHLHVTLRPDAPLPAILFESATPLGLFQDAMEKQWRFRPRVFVNAYTIAGNLIFLVDDAAHYGRHGRTLDDALAHELVHYLQVVYFKVDLGSRLIAEVCESEAVAVQEWFRARYVQIHDADPM
ncbi:hypothetical protein SVA_2542 [Sulfurifustis variabilis]|uniref:DUF4157 domain-containing protein n=1 Tax=Sulfurifustis variabilis TaxID=1675686 RepID=A0A1B4V6F0_9GAMM|nr:hypothetical protein [Sulfurifustis variabilis]BAU49090.1 hypothetical protein SVA_2542 [Sulfurifustis variabilis]